MLRTLYSFTAVDSSTTRTLGPDPRGGAGDVWSARTGTPHLSGTVPMSVVKETIRPVVFQHRRALPRRVGNNAGRR